MIVIAIDGPAASGKSSVARLLAEHLGFVYVNSGGMYRAITWEILKQGIDPTSVSLVETSANNPGFSNSFLHFDHDNSQAALRGTEVNRYVSSVAAVPAVRSLISNQLRKIAKDHNIVVEGRDIGSVVFPDTPYKFYLDAAPNIRQQRRAAEGYSDEITMRDKMDSSRQAAPLIKAPDAHIVDTTHLTLQGVVTEILKILKSSGLAAVS